MTRIIWLLIAVSMLLCPTFSYAGIVAPVRVRLMSGEVLFRTPEAGEWLPASINTPLDEGDSIWCPQGTRSEVQLSDGTIVRLDGGSQLDLIANEDGFTHLHLANGRLYLRTAQTMSRDSLQIDADDTTVVPSARTRLRIDMLANSQEDVSIFKGSAHVEGSGSRTTVRAGEHISLEGGHQEISPLNPADSWETWNKEQDLVQSRSAKTATHLPDELKYYDNELGSNGRWERVPEYGMVWRPTVLVSADWAPYRSGRWIWKGNDYVWISYESWGWVPYHFGRWAVITGLGWCWVPPTRGDIYWGPGYVGWHRTGTTIGWTPLAPGEIFYGRRYYGTNSVNISTTYVNQSTIVYRNKNHRGGLTVIGQNDFLRGNIAYKTPSNSLSVSVSIGSPQIQAVRETRMPLIKQTPQKLIPPRSNQVDIHDLRIRFPRIIPSREKYNRPQAPITTIRSEQQTPNYRDEKRVIHPVTPPNKPERTEQPQRHDYRHSAPQQISPAHESRPSAVTPPATPAAQSPTKSRGEESKRDMKQRENKQKRVWKITTKDQADEKPGKEEKGHKENREHRGK